MAQSHVHKFTFYFNVWMEVLLYQQSLHNFNSACMHMQVSINSNSIGFWLKVYEIINVCLSAFTITDTHVSLYKRHACGRARIHAQYDRCSAADVCWGVSHPALFFVVFPYAQFFCCKLLSHYYYPHAHICTFHGMTMHSKAPISNTSHSTFNTPLHTCTFNFIQYTVTAAF